MAQKVNIVLVDDLDGTEATETVTFGLDGTTYEIDLNDANAAALREALSLSREACRARAEAQWSHRLMIDRYERLLADVAAGRVARG